MKNREGMHPMSAEVHASRALPLLVVGFVVGGIGGFAGSSAQAAYERLSALTCKRNQPEGDHRYDVSVTLGAWLEERNLGNRYICPIPDDSALPLTSITSLELAVYDGNTNESIVAKACSLYQPIPGGVTAVANLNGGPGAWCGFPGDSTTGTGPDTLQLPVWVTINSQQVNVFDATETGYIYADLPAKEGSASSGKSKIYHIYAHN
jgi:hypothetical protein